MRQTLVARVSQVATQGQAAFSWSTLGRNGARLGLNPIFIGRTRDRCSRPRQGVLVRFPFVGRKIISAAIAGYRAVKRFRENGRIVWRHRLLRSGSGGQMHNANNFENQKERNATLHENSLPESFGKRSPEEPPSG